MLRLLHWVGGTAAIAARVICGVYSAGVQTRSKVVYEVVPLVHIAGVNTAPAVRQPVRVAFTKPGVHVADVNTGTAQLETNGVEPSAHEAGNVAAATAALPPKLAANETLVGDSTAGARAVVPAVTANSTVVILPVASAIVSGTLKPPHPSATELDVNLKMPPWLNTVMT